MRERGEGGGVRGGLNRYRDIHDTRGPHPIKDTHGSVNNRGTSTYKRAAGEDCQGQGAFQGRERGGVGEEALG